MKNLLLDIDTQTLTRLLQLRLERERIDAELAALAGGGEEPGEVATAPRTRRPRGSIQNAILGVLENDTNGGVPTREIIQRTGLDRETVDRWLFSGSAKRRGVVRAGRATYRLRSSRPSRR